MAEGRGNLHSRECARYILARFLTDEQLRLAAVPVAGVLRKGGPKGRYLRTALADAGLPTKGYEYRALADRLGALEGAAPEALAGNLDALKGATRAALAERKRIRRTLAHAAELLDTINQGGQIGRVPNPAKHPEWRDRDPLVRALARHLLPALDEAWKAAQAGRPARPREHAGAKPAVSAAAFREHLRAALQAKPRRLELLVFLLGRLVELRGPAPRTRSQFLWDGWDDPVRELQRLKLGVTKEGRPIATHRSVVSEEATGRLADTLIKDYLGHRSVLAALNEGEGPANTVRLVIELMDVAGSAENVRRIQRAGKRHR